MNTKHIQTAQQMIRLSALIRLVMIALAAVVLAFVYAYNRHNLPWIYRGNADMITVIVPVLLLDTGLTLVWLHPKNLYPSWLVLYTVHLVLYILYGIRFYTLYLCDVCDLYGGFGVMVFALLFALCIWLSGLSLFIICMIGRIKLEKATADASPESWT